MERVEQSLLGGLAAFRWLAWIWMAVVLVLARGNLVRPGLAVALVVAAFLVTVWLTVLARVAPTRLLAHSTIAVEVVVAVALQAADGVVYRSGHVFTPSPALGVAWPIAAALASGVALGPLGGVVVGIALGAARAASSVLAVVPGDDAWLGPLTPAETLSLVTTTVQYALAGGVAGYGVRLLRAAERRVAAAERALADIRARESVARRLHDGVLQTLALVERRADDPQLARLAREQERDLRGFLFGTGDPRVVGTGALGDALRAAADRLERHHDVRVEVLVPDDLPDLAPAVVDAVAGAVGEALTNAGKHGGATHVVVYAEPLDGDGLFVSVRDDGHGFDPATTTEGVGLRRSVRGRIAELGGDVDVVTAPGRGTEVRLRVPHVGTAGPG
jgi:signal transduction histidine kinase